MPISVSVHLKIQQMHRLLRINIGIYKMSAYGISKFSSRYAKAIWTSAGNVTPYLTMQWLLTQQLFLLDIWCFLWKAGNPTTNRSLGELFLYFSDEMSDITWIQAFQMLLQMFRTMLSDNTELSEEKINDLVDTFMNTLPALLKSQLQAA